MSFGRLHSDVERRGEGKRCVCCCYCYCALLNKGIEKADCFMLFFLNGVAITCTNPGHELVAQAMPWCLNPIPSAKQGRGASLVSYFIQRMQALQSVSCSRVSLCNEKGKITLVVGLAAVPLPCRGRCKQARKPAVVFGCPGGVLSVLPCFLHCFKKCLIWKMGEHKRKNEHSFSIARHLEGSCPHLAQA